LCVHGVGKSLLNVKKVKMNNKRRKWLTVLLKLFEERHSCPATSKQLWHWYYNYWNQNDLKTHCALDSCIRKRLRAMGMVYKLRTGEETYLPNYYLISKEGVKYLARRGYVGKEELKKIKNEIERIKEEFEYGCG